jgi:hypothetical protein
MRNNEFKFCVDFKLGLLFTVGYIIYLSLRASGLLGRVCFIKIISASLRFFFVTIPVGGNS